MFLVWEYIYRFDPPWNLHWQVLLWIYTVESPHFLLQQTVFLFPLEHLLGEIYRSEIRSLQFHFCRPVPNYQQCDPADQPQEETGLSHPRRCDRNLHHSSAALCFSLNAPRGVWRNMTVLLFITWWCSYTMKRLSLVTGGPWRVYNTFSWSSSCLGTNSPTGKFTNRNSWTLFGGGGRVVFCSSNNNRETRITVSILKVIFQTHMERSWEKWSDCN